jgi:ATP-dependent exoDNAse (exonuclease V) beta subunit
MKTAEVKTTGVANKTDNNATGNQTLNTGNGQKINNLPVSTAFNDKKDDAKKEEPKAEATTPQAEAQPQAEPSKKELKEQLKEQQERKLADTVKMVEVLGKKIAQRNKLENTIANIDGFTVAQNDDKDDMASDSRFARCELVISDDEGNEFVTKNPFIIAYVAHEVRELCVEKLKEVEASIVIPF